MPLEVRVDAVVGEVGVVDHLLLVERGKCHPLRSAWECVLRVVFWPYPVEDDAGPGAGVGPIEEAFAGPVRGAELWAESGGLIPEDAVFQEVLRDLAGVW